MSMDNMCIYSYDAEDLLVCVQENTESEFDRKLKLSWTAKMRKKCFRYTLDDVETKIIPGEYKFIAQIIFQLIPKHWEEIYATEAFSPPDRHLLLINVSPLEYCNSLLVPSVEKCHPQVLNLNGLVLAIETILMSHSPSLKIGMNSLGAFASVNHLHFHLYYLQETLYLQYAAVKHLTGDCYQLVDFPSEGFAFELLKKDAILSTAKYIMKLINYLQEERVAHNIFITRGKSFRDSKSEKGNVFNAVRIFVWARNSSFGSKNDAGFNPALCELAGHLPIKV